MARTTIDGSELTEAERSSRRMVVAVCIVGGIFLQYREHGAPGTILPVVGWLAQAIGSAAVLAIIPLIYGFKTRFRKPYLALIMFAFVFFAIYSGDNDRVQSQAQHATPVAVMTKADLRLLVNRFNEEHPEIEKNGNRQIMAANLRALDKANLSAVDTLNQAYQRSIADPHWVQSAQ